MCEGTVPSFDFISVFDKLSGYMDVRENGLVVSNMNSSYGGISSTDMSDTTIKDAGSFPSIFKVGNT